MEQDPFRRQPDVAAIDRVPVHTVTGGRALLQNIKTYYPELEIRDEQVDCLDAMQSRRDVGDPTILINMAFGLGKTTVAAVDAKRFVQERPGSKILFLSHQRYIGAQALTRFVQVFGEESSFGTFTGTHKNEHGVDGLFASFQSMRNHLDRFRPDEFRYIIVDESHHSMADTYEPVIRHFKPECLVGITGVPERQDLRDIREIFGEEDFTITLEEALARQLLTDVDYRVITDNLRPVDIKRALGGQNIRMGQLNRTLFLPMRDREMARLIKENAEEIEGPVRRLIFCNSIQETEEFRPYFGGKAQTLHSGIRLSERDRRYHALRDGELETLLVVDMFNEGVDIPEVNQVVFRRRTDSKTVFFEQLGRGLRRIPGKKLVQVLDCTGSFERLLLVDKLWSAVETIREFSPRTRDKPDVTYNTVSRVHFTQDIRDILDIIRSIGSDRQTLSAEASATYYKKLCADVGRLATIPDIETADGPSLKALVRPYGGRLSRLRQACGLQPYLGNDWSGWRAEDSRRIYRELSGDTALSGPAFAAKLRERKDLPGFAFVVAPFGGISALQIASGYRPTRQKWDDWHIKRSVAIYCELSGDEPLTYPVLSSILSDLGLPNIEVFLQGVEMGEFQEMAGYERILPDWSGWTAADSETLYMRLSGKHPLPAHKFAKILRDDPELPSLATVLAPHGGKIANLQVASGYLPGIRNWEGRWSVADSARLYRELSGEQPLGSKQFDRALQERRDAPNITIALAPFKMSGGINGLRIVAGYLPPPSDWSKWTAKHSAYNYRQLSGAQPLTVPKLRQALASRPDLPPLAIFLGVVGTGKIADLRYEAGY